AASHTFTVPSPPAEASHLPSRLKATLPAEASNLPSGLKATLRTGPACPLRVRASRPVAASHTFTPRLQGNQMDSNMVKGSFRQPVCGTRKRQPSRCADRALGRAGPVRLLLGGEDAPAAFDVLAFSPDGR